MYACTVHLIKFTSTPARTLVLEDGHCIGLFSKCACTYVFSFVILENTLRIVFAVCRTAGHNRISVIPERFFSDAFEMEDL